MMAKRLFEQGMRSAVSRRALLQGGAGLIGGTMLLERLDPACGRRRPGSNRHLARRLAGRHGVYRRFGAAHWNLCGAG